MTSSPDDVGEEIARVATFLLHLDRYWQRVQRQGLSPERRQLIESSLVAAQRRIAELASPTPPARAG